MKKLLSSLLLFLLLPVAGWTETLSLDCTSTRGGTTYNWASVEAGFNYNDAMGIIYGF